MQSSVEWLSLAAEPRFELSRAGRQWLDVTAHVVERYLVTFRVKAESLSRLVPAPFAVDAFGGFGFVSVCALELSEMGLCGAPSFLRFQNLEFLYRVGVRHAGAASFLTLRSDVSSGQLAFLGRPFSHYRPNRGVFSLSRAAGFRLECKSSDGAGDALLEAGGELDAEPRSVFASAAQASEFLLGMNFSVDVRPSGRVQTQHIEHEPWGARFVDVPQRHFEYLERLEPFLGTSLVFDHALVMRDLRQVWKAARCQ